MGDIKDEYERASERGPFYFLLSSTRKYLPEYHVRGMTLIPSGCYLMSVGGDNLGIVNRGK
jgi:hypothetical protein